jgi:hypothetical protein
MQKQQLIFLTGLPRSGSTWAARALSHAAGARLVHEPFNWRAHPELIEFHVRYLPAGSYEPKLLHAMNGALKGRFPFSRRAERVLIKDVHVCLALPYIEEHFQPHALILVRHPCGMAQSWQRLGLEVDFRLDLLLAQETLRRGWLAPFVEHLRRRGDYFFSLGAYWGASHFLLQQMAVGQPTWQWATHEWFCADPPAHFQETLAHFGLHMGRTGQAKLAQFLLAHDRRQHAGESEHSVARQTALEPDKWRRELSAVQIAAVLAGVAPFGMLERFADDWAG